MRSYIFGGKERKKGKKGKKGIRSKSKSIKNEMIFSIVTLTVFIIIGFGIITPTLNYKTVIVSILSLIGATVTGSILSKNIAEPITKCAERIQALSLGDLHSEIEVYESDNEIGKLTKSLKFTVKGLSNVISDITFHLGEIAYGNLTTDVELDYLGDLDAIEHSIKRIIKSLNNIMLQIDTSSEEVSNNADQVAGGAQALSHGASEQASSIEELVAAISEISEQINQNAINAESAKDASNAAAEEVQKSSNQVNEMSKAINEINITSIEIEKIIKAIEDIAFQTNILALNAAVEAARAGSAGKGFAVVADEVRNLASKSAEAAKSTNLLIENSLKAVSNGVKIAERTEETLKSVVEKSNVALSLVEEIALASHQQALGISQVSIGMEQISAVVQANSATAEESAAASEELSSQAQVLKGLMEGIKLKNSIFEEKQEALEA